MVTNQPREVNQSVVNEKSPAVAMYPWSSRSTPTGLPSGLTTSLTARAWDNNGAVGTSVANVTINWSVYQSDAATNGADALIANQSHATTKYGAMSILEVASSEEPYDSRTLVRFDVTPLSFHATVGVIVLQLTASYVHRESAGPYLLNVYRATNSWVEADVTWNQRQNGATWATAGGEYDTNVLATFDWSGLTGTSLTVDASHEQFNIEILPGQSNAEARTALINAWLAGNNNGLLLRQQTEGLHNNDFLGIRSREQPTGAYHPRLFIYYIPPPAGTVITFW